MHSRIEYGTCLSEAGIALARLNLLYQALLLGRLLSSYGLAGEEALAQGAPSESGMALDHGIPSLAKL
jgi:hypothetical protein